ncbi:MAG: fumarate hydratase [Candidatus Verstraetearchaeota archaeon]|jgi:fumarate hydratase subunit alpha|nr:fumarate hydratase [Candidatus Verstraetearchaeota archaeon]
MNDIDTDIIVEAIRKLECDLPEDIERKLLEIREKEEGLSRIVVDSIIENIKYAREEKVPICQDTGIIEFFVKCSKEFKKIKKVIEEAIRRAVKEVPIRANTVNPFTRENQGENLGRFHPIIYFEYEDNDFIEIDILAKGAGSENVSRVYMLDPLKGIKGIKEAVIDTVRKADGKPCPPIIVGIGIGGNMELAIHLSKYALLRPINQRSSYEVARNLEEELIEEINNLGIGPMGFGGKTTALNVAIEWAHCHTASLPLCVNIQCWALRRISILYDGKETKIVR